MNPHELDQETQKQEWLDARLGKVTASRVADVLAKPRSKGQGMATSRRNYMAQLACELLTGKSAEGEEGGYKNWHMERGTRLEPEARIEYELKFDVEVQKVGFVAHPRIPRFGCSPDAYVGKKGMAQFKAPIPAIHFEFIKYAKLKTVPPDYFPQLQAELACNPDREWDDLVSYNKSMPEHLQLVVIRAYRDEQFIKDLEAAVLSFNREVDEMIEALPKQEDPLTITDADVVLGSGR